MDRSAADGCELEAIHRVEQVQPFGVLLAISATDGTVLRASTNAVGLFGQPVLGGAAEDLLGYPDSAGLAALWAGLSAGEVVACRLTVRAPLAPRLHDAAVHLSDGAILVEVELAAEHADGDADGGALQAALGRAMHALQAAPACAALCRALTTHVAAISGYDRVMVYRFDETWCGEVVAETRAPTVASYQGQRFPASDIPAQAREVFRQNWLRIIPDVAAAPVAIERLPQGADTGPLDLSLSLLRAASPVHREYLTNMQVAASMTVSLQQDGRLWGLIACHHAAPRHVAASVRQACEVVGRMASALLVAKQRDEDAREIARRAAVSEQLAAQMAAGTDLAEELLKRPVHVLDLVDAGGAAAYLQGSRWALMGRVPPLEHINRLVQWLAQTRPDCDVFATSTLAELYPPAAEFEDVAAGLLAIAIPKSEHHYVLWFRPEVIQTTTWAGDPRKSVTVEEGTPHLHPRQSFARWRETVRHRALSWSAADSRAAAALREAIIEIDLSRQFLHERRARAESDGQRSRFAFLAEASSEIAGSLHDEGALHAFARLVTCHFCDWMALYFVAGRGEPASIGRHLVWHRTDAGQRVIAELRGLPGLAASPRPELRAIFRGEAPALCVARTSQRWLLDHAPGPEYVRFIRRQLGMESLLLLPMAVRGRFLGVLKLVRAQPLHRFDDADVALARELARQLGQARDNALLYADAQHAVQARDHVISVVSHDLKTPLGAIQLNVDGMRRRLAAGRIADLGELVAPLHHSIGRISGAAGRMRRLIDNILNVTQVEAGTLPVDLASVSTQQIERDALELLVPLAEDHGVALRSEIAGPPVAVQCDLDRIIQVLSNLIGNALKFTPRHGQVVLQIAPMPTEVRFCVRDSGPGIAAAALPHVFDRFWQARHTARMGAGLGLAIAKGIVEAHKGRIWAESVENEGAAFTFSLPRVAGP